MVELKDDHDVLAAFYSYKLVLAIGLLQNVLYQFDIIRVV